MKGLDVLQRRLGSIKQAIADKNVWKAAAQQWLNEDVLPEARALAPVRTGELRDSIGGRVGERQVTVFATADHAQHVEDGTSKMAAQPFLRPAVQRKRRKLSERVRKAYEGRLK